ncbi:outer membrane protein assembly factor BamA [Chitinophaga terrae (ex Kim and Jung 2007)]|jgi:outer membrane protein assembly factor BamA|uniref:translocation and assembly module lipoprotein TamL n=1 Tax=Chitinophaga terrae (ex Kim and Jung 2007) TaxID=408074 RepID=UPI0027887D82|nr:BamA/TamA family outer membrane protein [Chitinophaga terrae (ex Kim and Jung 2007)]MDQ0105999.1 outer membrane protein assembly factor BamA [Chitinophaga terrae (ex Kim and Jung 2007)]
MLNSPTPKYLLPKTWLLVAVVFVLAGCSNTKYLQQGQTLYTSSKVEVEGEILNSEKQDLRSALSSKSLMTQQPNTKLLTTRIKVWLYNQKYNEKKSNWFWNLVLAKRNLEEPVIYDSTKTKESLDRMSSYLHNQGFFHATVDYKEKTRRRKTNVVYHVNTGRNFVVDKISYDIPDTAIKNIVLANEHLSQIRKGMIYKSATLGSERERLTRLIRDAGYYKFNRDAIEFTLDTLNKSLFRNTLNPFEGFVNIFNENKGREKLTMDILIHVKNPEDSATRWQLYHIGKIYAYPDFSLNANPSDTTLKEDVRKYITIRYHQEILRPRILSRSILLRPGEPYSLQQYNNTINKLYDLGVWQFVTLNYKEPKDTVNTLDAYLQLTPRRKQELGVTFEVSNSSDYTLGSGVTLNFRHINLRRTATQFGLTLNTGLELVRQKSGWDLQAKQFGGEMSLTWPRFAMPFNLKHTARSNVKTRLTLGANYLSRIDKFDITSINASFGYDWNETAYKRWIVRPITLNYVGVSLNPGFRDTVVNDNPYLKRSFEPALIGGESVSFIFNNQDILHPRHYTYFRANLEESGLWLSGINSIMNRISKRETNLETLTNVNISNFVKLELDYRHFWKLGIHSVLATRAYAGVGIPYSYSTVLPYVRQFTAGGPNSIRAWRLRTLGPGSYKDSSKTAQTFPDQTGDMKLEGNIEYRFDLLRMFGGTVNLKGATFLDIGNIWMIRKDSTRPGSEFRFGSLYHDLAMGTGAGLRLDFSFFLVRLDWGIPLKVPYFQGNKNGWYISEWDLKDSRWRRENIIWNIAIGYPF